MAGTTVYPGSIDAFGSVENKQDAYDADDINDLRRAVEAIETELGADVAGSVADLVTRLAVSLADSGALAQGTSNPLSPVIGQPFYRTDTDNFQIYDGSAWDIVSSALTLDASDSPSAASSSSLTVEADAQYLLTFSLINNHASTGAYLYLRFNNDATGTDYDYYVERNEFNSAGGDVKDRNEAQNQIQLIPSGTDGIGDTGEGGYVTGFLYINTHDPIANIDAGVHGQFHYKNNDSGGIPTRAGCRVEAVYYGGAVTSVQLLTDTTFTGEVRLYKLANS